MRAQRFLPHHIAGTGAWLTQPETPKGVEHDEQAHGADDRRPGAEQFNTAHSTGRLTLNILPSFAQFEREIIGERTQDKTAAARREGEWSGGKPLLGYDVVSAPAGSRLVVRADEAHRVRGTFELYLQH